MTFEELAKVLCTDMEHILRWAALCGYNAERDGGNISRMLVNMIRTKHLEETHGKIYRMLADIYSPELAYERWVCMLDRILHGKEVE